MRTLTLLLLLFACVTSTSAKEDEWAIDRPASSPHGKRHTLRIALDAAKSHHGVVQHKQVSKVAQGGLTIDMAFETHVRVLETLKEGHTKVGGEIHITRLELDGDDLTEAVAPAITAAYVTGVVRAGRTVDGCRRVNTQGLRQLAMVFTGLPALVMPYLPAPPVRVGEVWSLPPQYVLWNVGQPMDGKPQGESFQVFEALEEQDGVPCARIRTALAVRTELANGAGMLPKGPAVSTIKVEMRHWLGLDGYLRASETTARMLVTHTKTKQTIQWSLERSVKAGPAPVPAKPLGKSWAEHMGDLPFIVGHEAGMKEARFTGRAPMFFLTSHASPAGRTLGAKAFLDAKVCKQLAGYTPILIDGQKEKAFHESRGKGSVLLDPTLLWEDLDGDTLFTMAGGLPDIPGVDMAEIVTTMFSIPADRTPEARPSAAYTALLAVRDRLRAALEHKNTAAAMAAILEIENVGLGQAIQAEAAGAKEELLKRGAEASK